MWWIKALGWFNGIVHASATFWGGFQLIVAITTIATLVALPVLSKVFIIACFIGTGLLAALTLSRKAIYKFYYNESVVPFYTEKCKDLRNQENKKIKNSGFFKEKPSISRFFESWGGTICSVITAIGFSAFSYQAGVNIIPAIYKMFGINHPAIYVAIGVLWALSTLGSSTSFYAYFRKQKMPETSKMSWPMSCLFYTLPIVPALATCWMIYSAISGLPSPWVNFFHNFMALPGAIQAANVLAVIVWIASGLLIYKLFLVGMDRIYRFCTGSDEVMQLLGLPQSTQTSSMKLLNNGMKLQPTETSTTTAVDKIHSKNKALARSKENNGVSKAAGQANKDVKNQWDQKTTMVFSS